MKVLDASGETTNKRLRSGTLLNAGWAGESPRSGPTHHRSAKLTVLKRPLLSLQRSIAAADCGS